MLGRFITTTVFIFIFIQPASADVYRYTGEDGVECYTDTPANSGATLIMKDRRQSGGKSKGNSTIPSEAASTKYSRLPVQGRVTSYVGVRTDPIDGDLRHHKGIDIAVPHGTQVRPVSGGTIIFSGPRQGYGNTVMVRHADGLITLYAHNSENTVSEGTTVDAGTVIALSGATGRCTGPHLHFEAWLNGQNVTSDYVSGSDVASAGAAKGKAASWVKRYTQEDGTLVFTNLH